MNMDNKEIIAELERIDGLLNEFYRLNREFSDVKEQKDTDLRNIYQEYHPNLPKAPQAFGALAQEPDAFVTNYAGKIKITALGTVVTLVTWLIAGMFPPNGVTGYAILATIIFAVLFFYFMSKFGAEKREYDKKIERRNKFEELLKSSHAQEKSRFEAALTDYYTQYQIYDHKFDEYYEAYVDRHNALIDQIKAVKEQIDAVTLLGEDHITLAGDIKTMLQNGRADTFKEALNLAIAEQRDIEFKARQLEEESRRTAIAEQQAYEERMHNERMEREAAAQTRQAQMQAQIAEAQLKATEQQNKQLQEILKNQNKR